jgi:cell division protein FtsQ
MKRFIQRLWQRKKEKPPKGNKPRRSVPNGSGENRFQMKDGVGGLLRRFWPMSKESELPSNKKVIRPNTLKKSSEGQPRIRRGKELLLAIMRLALTTVIAGATVWAGFAAYRHTTTSEYFAVKEYALRGLHRLSEAEVLATADFSEQTNIFKMDVEKARLRLMEHEWIDDVYIKRRLPRAVEIVITERHAVATVIFDVPYLVDDSGEVFKRWVRGDPVSSPVVTGFTREDFLEDGDGTAKKIRDAIDLAARYRTSGLERRAPLAEIHHEEDGDFSLVVMDTEPVYVKFGGGPYRKKIKRLAALLHRLRRDGHSPSMIYFDNEIRPNRITVKLRTKENQTTNSIKRNVDKNILQKRMSKI